MSVLVVGVSHRTAPVSMLERLALDPAGATKLARAVADTEHVSESVVLATCNRVEIYAAADRFHGSVDALTRLLCEVAGEPGPAESAVAGLEPVAEGGVLPHLYVHYDDGAVSHLFHVVTGLDSMVVGEGQVLGQVRDALRQGQEQGTVGASLNLLFQQALRVGKRSHAETDIDRSAPSLVAVALDRAAEHLGREDGDLSGVRALVVGAGSMASLSVATLTARGAASVVVGNRTPEHARRLAAAYEASAVTLGDLDEALETADVVVSCTGSVGTVLGVERVRAARAAVPSQPLAVVDLALPHDVEPEVAGLDGVRLVGLAQLADEVQSGAGADDVADVRSIVAQEISAFLAARRSAAVTPTVVALRSLATEVVDAEVARLQARVPDLPEATRAELERTVRRVADKLLHTPTVRVKELAESSGEVSYATALAELFALNPETVDAVTRAEGVDP